MVNYSKENTRVINNDLAVRVLTKSLNQCNKSRDVHLGPFASSLRVKF
jgi:hypothetical protein